MITNLYINQILIKIIVVAWFKDTRKLLKTLDIFKAQ